MKISSKNVEFAFVRKMEEVNIDEITLNEELKACDEELLALMEKYYLWDVPNVVAKIVVNKCLTYLDSLCSIRFDITPKEDVEIVREAMCNISNITNVFIGCYLDNEQYSIHEKIQLEAGEKAKQVKVCLPENAIFYECSSLSEIQLPQNVYASYIVRHAHQLAPCLLHARPDDINGYEKEVLEVLDFVAKKTRLLLGDIA